MHESFSTGDYAPADLTAAQRRARLAREKAKSYGGSSEQMRRKLEARARMAETEAALIAHAIANAGQPSSDSVSSSAMPKPPSPT